MAGDVVAPRGDAERHRPRRSGAQRAILLLWVAFAFFLAGTGVGIGWDRRWHATHRFEDFWSPPHLFIYLNVLLASGVVAFIVCSPPVRRWFGPGFRLPLVPLAVPGPLALLGAGMVAVGAAGALDAVWHTAFGLDETGWSLPHAMLGRAIMLAFWGFVACRLALARYGRLRGYTRLLLGWVLLGVTADLLGGPLLTNLSPGALRAMAASPIALADGRLAHVLRIYLAWHLDRAHPLYLPLAAFSVGAGLSLVRRLLRGDRWMVGAALLMGLLPLLQGDPPLPLPARLWLPHPFLPAALTFAAARRLGVPQRWAWALAGWACCLWALPVSPHPVVALLSGPLALVGAAAGERVGAVVEQPRRRAVVGLTGLVAGVLPLCTGALDLYLRVHTP